MDAFNEFRIRQLQLSTRRHFLKKCTTGLGMLTLGSFLGGDSLWGQPHLTNDMRRPSLPHFAPKVKRVIYLHMTGGPSQLELFDYKPDLQKLHNQDCPDSFLEGKRFAFIQGKPKMLGPQQPFKQYGDSGAFVSDALPLFSKHVDEVTMLKAMYTDEFNHAPAQLFLQTGSARVGRPSMGAWLSYGLGSENENLPSFMVLVSGGKDPDAGKNGWGSGFLPSEYQGVQCRSSGDPILYVSNPYGMSRDMRGKSIAAINELNRLEHEEMGDPEVLSRIAQYEMAYKMQVSVPEVMDISKEPAYIHQMYGTEPGKTSFANNCLLARRLLEQGVRFVQLYDWGWDMHGTQPSEDLGAGMTEKCQLIDRPIAALLEDLKQRGLMEDTLVVWGGEFGRTPMRENRGGQTMSFQGRDHHAEAFTIWLAGAGLKKGFSFGETDDIGYFGVKDRTHVHDLQATILHLLGIDHERFTYPFQGRNYRLTDVHGSVVKDILT
ncbi:MAG: DUF1501 domain-containing protein [Saprospiraceae bacterium]